jgi:hypothetical protein
MAVDVLLRFRTFNARFIVEEEWYLLLGWVCWVVDILLPRIIHGRRNLLINKINLKEEVM